MARKAFLYTGAAFLVMIAILISANYLFLSKHTATESKNTDLEIDAINNLVNDVRNVIMVDSNNTMADALSDAAFSAIQKSSGSAVPIQQLSSKLDPSNKDSEASFTNISKWLLNYTNITLSKIKSLSSLSINFSYPVSNDLKIATGYRGPPNLPYIFSVSYAANISYILTFNGSTSFMLNQTLQRNKTLSVSQLTVEIPKNFCIYVTDNTKGTFDFKKGVSCNPICAPTSSVSC